MFFLGTRQLGLTVLALLFCAMPALATHPDSKSEIENLKARIQALEAERDQPPGYWPLSKQITLSGLLKLEANVEKSRGAATTSDLSLATAVLSTEVQIDEHVGGHIILLWEEGENAPIDIDEAIFVLRPAHSQSSQSLTFIGGKMYLPFGSFNSFMLSDPLTLELGETNNTAAVIDLDGTFWTLKAGLFNGDVDQADQSDRIDSWVVALAVTPTQSITIAASYLSDLAESGAELVEDTVHYHSDNPAVAVSLSVQLDRFSLVAEYLTALKRFDAVLVAAGQDLTGQRPSAWNLELAWMPNQRVQLAARAEGAADFKNDTGRYGAAVSYGIHESTLIALEYLYSLPKGDAHPPHQRLTAQLVFQF